MPPKSATKKAPAKAKATAKAAKTDSKKSPKTSPKASPKTSPKKSPTKKVREKAEDDDGETSDDKEPAKKRGRKESAAATTPAPQPAKTAQTKGPTVTAESILSGTTPFARKTKDAEFDPKTMIKILCWNVAGIRALLQRGTQLEDLIKSEQPDVVCLQETKLSDAADAAKTGPIDGYTFEDSISTAKKGYAGTRTYVRNGAFPFLKTTRGFDISKNVDDDEGRILATTFGKSEAESLTIVNSYVPNSGLALDRLDYRVKTFDPMMRKYLAAWEAKVPGRVLWTGDLNVAERDYDRFFQTSYNAMQKSPGFTPEERASFRTTLQQTKMVDFARHLYPTANNMYTFWSYRFDQRARGNGWRLDYFIASAALLPRLVDCFPLTSQLGSDHCPLLLWLRR